MSVLRACLCCQPLVRWLVSAAPRGPKWSVAGDQNRWVRPSSSPLCQSGGIGLDWYTSDSRYWRKKGALSGSIGPLL